MKKYKLTDYLEEKILIYKLILDNNEISDLKKEWWLGRLNLVDSLLKKINEGDFK